MNSQWTPSPSSQSQKAGEKGSSPSAFPCPLIHPRINLTQAQETRPAWPTQTSTQPWRYCQCTEKNAPRSTLPDYPMLQSQEPNAAFQTRNFPSLGIDPSSVPCFHTVLLCRDQATLNLSPAWVATHRVTGFHTHIIYLRPSYQPLQDTPNPTGKREREQQDQRRKEKKKWGKF